MPKTKATSLTRKVKEVLSSLTKVEAEETPVDDDKPLVKGTFEYRWDRLQWLRSTYYKTRDLSFMSVENTVYVDIRCVALN
jgi:hypothetical protein